MTTICYKDGEKMVFQEDVCPAGWSNQKPEQPKKKAPPKKKTVKKKVFGAE